MIDVKATFKWAGDAVIDAVMGRIDQRLNEVGSRWLSIAQSLAPVDTGQLRSGLYYRVEGRTLIVGGTAPHTLFQEAGTRVLMPRHFMRDALLQVEPLIGADVEMHFTRPGGELWHGIHLAGGLTVVPRGLSGKQIAHVRQHVAPSAKRLHRGNVKRAKMVVRRFQ